MVRLFAFVLTLFTSATALGFIPHEDGTINAVIGDVSWHKVHDGTEVQRIQAHLDHVLAELEHADVTELDAQQRAARRHLLAELRAYMRAGVFPRRAADDGQGLRRPRFIDDRGVHCAVGELIRRSGHERLARQIDAVAEFDYVADMNFAGLNQWASDYGFTRRELAMIQPAYAPPPTEEIAREFLTTAKDRITMKCAAHEVPASIKVQYQGDGDGNVSFDGNTSTPFSKCFMSALGQNRLGGGAWDSRPRSFRGSLNLSLTPPRQQIQERFDRVDVSGPHLGCSPRPGALVHTATVLMKVDALSVSFDVRTEPENPEVSLCIAEKLQQAFRDVPPGAGDFELRATRQLGATVNQGRLEQVIPHYAKTAGLECWEADTPVQREIAVVATPEAEQFEVVSPGGSEEFEACFIEHLQERLRSDFAVSRKLPDGTYERYFRIDAAARVTMRVELMTPEQKQKQDEEHRKRMEQERYQLN